MGGSGPKIRRKRRGNEVTRQYAINPTDLANLLDIPQDEVNILLTGGDHPYSCRCDACLKMWRLIGPDPDTERYGPFTEQEIQGERE